MQQQQKGTVFDRLYDTRSYTGVYAERFKGADGRINSHTDLSARSPGSAFTGNTNTGTNEVIHDISQIMRPNLRMQRPKQSPARGKAHVEHKRFSVSTGMWYDEDSNRPVNATYVEPSSEGLDTAEQLRHIFRYYCAFGRTGAKGANEDTIDSLNFMKFARECPGLLDRRLNKTEVDLIFTKAKQKFERRLDFTHFLDALSAMAAKKYPKYDPTTAFSVLLAHHIFLVPCAPQSLRSQMQEMAPKQSEKQNQRASPATQNLYDKHEQQYQRTMNSHAMRQNMSSPKQQGQGQWRPQTSPGRMYGTPGKGNIQRFTSPNNATIAGSANIKGGVYDRLSSKQTYTGVYRRRFDGDGRINAHTDLTASSTQFKGNTNTRTNENFHSIKGMLRTNLSSGGSRMMRF